MPKSHKTKSRKTKLLFRKGKVPAIYFTLKSMSSERGRIRMYLNTKQFQEPKPKTLLLMLDLPVRAQKLLYKHLQNKFSKSKNF